AQETARRQLGQDGHRDVLADGHRLDEALLEAVLGQVGEAAAQGGPRPAGAEGAALDLELAGVERVDPEDAPRNLGAAGADGAGAPSRTGSRPRAARAPRSARP